MRGERQRLCYYAMSSLTLQSLPSWALCPSSGHSSLQMCLCRTSVGACAVPWVGSGLLPHGALRSGPPPCRAGRNTSSLLDSSAVLGGFVSGLALAPVQLLGKDLVWTFNLSVNLGWGFSGIIAGVERDMCYPDGLWLPAHRGIPYPQWGLTVSIETS